MILSLGLASVLSFIWLPSAQSSGPNAVAQQYGLYVGSATDNPELTDAAYLSILNDTELFGEVTPGNTMKWGFIEPELNKWNFGPADQIVAIAEATNKIIRGHTLIWYNSVPPYVAGGGTSDLMTEYIVEHVDKEVAHYAGKLASVPFSFKCFTPLQDSWDVVNEPLNDDGTFRDDVFFEALGSSYINLAFTTAYAADPKAKLYINEYGLEYYGAKVDAMVALVKDLLGAGVPIHGIGFQCHYVLGEVDPAQLKANMEKFTALGLETAVTELDVRIKTPATDADLQQQMVDYQSVVSTCVGVQNCVGMTLWDFTDKYSWIPAAFSGYGQACPWDANLQEKPAYSGIMSGLTK